jgi:hypothetical protein
MTNPSYVSDELTHFLGRSLPDHQSRYALLREILRTGWLKASHRDQLGPGIGGQSDGGKALSGNDAIKCTSVAFCDIPNNPAHSYEEVQLFGVAFDKRIMLHSGATPVHGSGNARHRGAGIGPKIVETGLISCAKRSEISNDLGSTWRHTMVPPAPNPCGPVRHGYRLMGQFSASE